MASITVCNLDDDLKNRLRIRAAENGRSMEQEFREILRSALEVDRASPAKGLATAIHERFAPFGGAGIELPLREPMREPPRVD